MPVSNETDTLFKDHLKHLKTVFTKALGERYEQLFALSGQAAIYAGNDIEVPFRAHPFFLWVVPINRPDCIWVFDKNTQEFQVHVKVEPTFWDDTSLPESERQVLKDFKVTEHRDNTYQDLLKNMSSNAARLNLTEPDQLAINEDFPVHAELTWARAYKTNYEVHCIRQANHQAAISHAAARDCYMNGGTEWDIHQAYLKELPHEIHLLPYPNIIACGANGAFLHYHRKDRITGPSMMIDAGSPFRGYASDITRTYAEKKSASVFIELIKEVGKIQDEIIKIVKPGASFIDLHFRCHQLTAATLLKLGIVKGITPEAVVETGLSEVFLPHGLGHLLGLAVHDPGGHFADASGKTHELPKQFGRFLRCRRNLDSTMTITIEPGIYMIRDLLEKAEQNKNYRPYLNHPTINALRPYGGVRLEDDILVTQNGANNLTRPYLEQQQLFI